MLKGTLTKGTMHGYVPWTSTATESKNGKTACPFLNLFYHVLTSYAPFKGNLTLGYVTNDECGPDSGDDSTHAPLQIFDIPDFIASNAPSNITETDTVDLVFLDFFEDQLIETLNGLQSDKTYSSEDVAKYSEVLTNSVLGIYAQQAWN